MIDPLLLLAAFLTGLTGAGHCAGMCGGIAGAMMHAVPQGMSRWSANLGFSLGRITTYTVLGALVGGIALLLTPADMGVAMLVTRLLTGLVFLLIGLYLLRALLWLRFLEQAGAGLWRHIAPLARRLMPVTSLPRALAVGAVWGFLPCGLVYGALLYAASSGSPASGAATMAAFGAGTLPAVLGLGIAGGWLARHGGAVRNGSGALMLLFGAWTIVSTLLAWPAILDGTCRSPGDVFQYAISLLMHVKAPHGP